MTSPIGFTDKYELEHAMLKYCSKLFSYKNILECGSYQSDPTTNSETMNIEISLDAMNIRLFVKIGKSEIKEVQISIHQYSNIKE